ncbi:hypothetical protein Celaphus_00014049 [Cervus elaphus hippelaphus]|uniref:Uncharacterized protein n=1 Tax=Cervus elaphus hippelaphus TaxID=46360 RepID=A0A212CCP6_CEREH|nr:hypothetical protein Celaphus_00014049 [Cervus elaphus hippelaphus]
MAAPMCVPKVEAAGSLACPAHPRGRRQEPRDGEFWRARERELACPAHPRGRRQEPRDGEFWRAREREGQASDLRGGTRLATSPTGKTGHPCKQVTWMGRTTLQIERWKTFSFANF